MNNKTVFAIILIFLNGWGVPSFMQGRTKEGVIRLVSTKNNSVYDLVIIKSYKETKKN